MIDQIARQSVEHFKSGYFCAESVLLAVSEHYGIKSSFIPGIATGFCSGTSRTQPYPVSSPPRVHISRS